MSVRDNAVRLAQLIDMWAMTVAEAMASDVPPVTTSAAGAADVIENGRTGFVLPEPLDVDLLASTCDPLLGDPELRRRIGRAVAVRARALTWEEHGRELEASMRNVAERRRRSALGLTLQPPSSTASGDRRDMSGPSRLRTIHTIEVKAPVTTADASSSRTHASDPLSHPRLASTDRTDGRPFPLLHVRTRDICGDSGGERRRGNGGKP